VLEAEEMAASLTGSELANLIHLGEAAAPLDPKLAALVLELRLIRLSHPGANVLVYTEYADTQRAAVAALEDFRVLTISGADAEAARTLAAERCAEEDGLVLISTDSLAEGLNLHRRCRHLIHLDLPYNPNRLEQRNGRIDRYGQRHDPEIRYFYLAGTFEERLLLRLIAKYEAARACLAVMPNTLAVTAPAGSLHEPLTHGFAETLFSGEPRLVHSLDLAAEDEASISYRDLLREIDRAFAAFDQMAVRHGWMNGVLDRVPADPVVAAIDLAAFVGSVLGPEGRVPAAWDLDGMPGIEDGVVRLTADPEQMHDALGRALLYPGRAHPLTRQAIASVRTGRVSAVRAGASALVLTYAAEIGGLFRAVFALRLSPDGGISEEEGFLALADRPAAAWQAVFPPELVAMAGVRAAVVAERLAAEFAAGHRERIARAEAAAVAWLERRTVELLGPRQARTGDLFENTPEPDRDLQRLAVAGDAAAAEALLRFQALRPDQTPLPLASVRWLGMLLLCP
jgi:hypothetical protein